MINTKINVSVGEYVRECDADFKKRLFETVDSIVERGNMRIISLTGPSCSGKTTAAHMIAQRFGELGKSVNIISIDDFYYNREHLHALSREKGLEIIDYDSADTIDLDALESFVEEAFSSDTVHCPVFDFKLGRRSGFKELRTADTDVFIFEGIQCLYPEIKRLIGSHGCVSIYITPKTPLTVKDVTLDSNEIRLLRRIVRDNNRRRTSAQETFDRWGSVRDNEEKNIFPFVDGCDYTIDSTHGYELGVLKPYLRRNLSAISEDSPHYHHARSILGLFEEIEEISRSLIGEDSLYREFV